MSGVRVIIISLALMMSLCACADERLDLEMKCLKVKPGDCSGLVISYPDPSLGDLECDTLLTSTDGYKLKDKPEIVVVYPKGQFPMPVLVVMFDPDAPTDHAEGFIHWMARGKMNKEGQISDLTSLPELDYYPPDPPAGASHRYQVFVFHADADKNIAASPSSGFIRLDHLCDFILRNDLQTPIASSQFKYET